MRQLIAGNWKMHGTSVSLAEVDEVARWAAEHGPPAEVLICPPATLIARAVEAAAGRIAIGGQDCSIDASGAFTGDISAEMLKDAGATAVIVGHSERRRYHAESDETVAAKVAAAWRAGLFAIVCVGESEDERKAGRARAVVAKQIAASLPPATTAATTAIAYEPVWAIGTGRTPTREEIGDMHVFIRSELREQAKSVKILYGGSVNSGNAGIILSLDCVDGALVGGASLKATDFRKIIAAADRRS